jgi:hypothetical protein
MITKETLTTETEAIEKVLHAVEGLEPSSMRRVFDYVNNIAWQVRAEATLPTEFGEAVEQASLTTL